MTADEYKDIEKEAKDKANLFHWCWEIMGTIVRTLGPDEATLLCAQVVEEIDLAKELKEMKAKEAGQ